MNDSTKQFSNWSGFEELFNTLSKKDAPKCVICGNTMTGSYEGMGYWKCLKCGHIKFERKQDETK